MSDYLMRMIDQIGEMARAIFDRQDDSDDIHMTSESSAAVEPLTVLLMDLLEKGKYGKAEDALFSYVQNDRSAYVLYAGKTFYAKLAELSEDELARGNFSREEIYQGLKDFAVFFKEDDSEDDAER